MKDKMEKPAVIEVDNVSFSYGADLVLQDAGFKILEGDFVSVVGPNGGGKTTLLKLILGLLKPFSGSIRVFGSPPDKVRRRVGYIPQRALLDDHFPVTVWDVVLMGRLRPFGAYRKADREAAAKSMAEVGLEGLGDRAFSELSGGQRQRVLIARALCSEPDLLLLDEPTANLDLKMEKDLYDLLRELNRRLTVFLVSHDLSFVSKTVETVVCVNRTVAVHPTSEMVGEAGEAIHGMLGEPRRLVRHDTTI